MSPSAYAFLGLTAIIAALAVAAMLAFVAVRFWAAARNTRPSTRGGGDTAVLTAALHEAVGSPKVEERASAARAEGPERMSGDILACPTAGLLVLGPRGDVGIVTPAGRRLLGLD